MFMLFVASRLLEKDKKIPSLEEYDYIINFTEFYM
jgi:hypothetical protein